MTCKICYSMVGCTGAFTILKEPVMALTDVLVAIVIKISLLVLKCCSMSQFLQCGLRSIHRRG